MKTIDLYHEAEKELGLHRFSKLILNERAYNQRHWASKLEKALKLKYLEDRVDAVALVIAEMKEQADRYEQG